MFNGLRYVVKTGAPWRWMPHDLPPWAAVYQQAQRWLSAGCFEQLAEDLRAVLRLAAGRKAEPSVVILDSRTLRATPESGERAGYDGAKRKQGSKLHMAVDTLGHFLALHVTPATPMTALRSSIWPRPCRRPLTIKSRSPSSIKAKPARSRPRLRASTASTWKS
ncbi:Transposase of ISMdi26, IS5 family [Methylorubrum aminovorans]